MYSRRLITIPLTLLLALSATTAAWAFQSHAGSFTDDDGSVFEANIEALADAAITKGCNPSQGNTQFCPDDNVTRGQMAAFLVRALDLPADGTDRFTDDDDSIFESSIQALAAAEITKGCNPTQGNTQFCPDEDVTRGQMAAFLVRALDLPADGTDRFTDDDDSIFESSIQALAKSGITVGCNPPNNDRFCPTSAVTRGQMAAFLARALDLTADDPTPFNNTTCDPAYSPCVPTKEEVGDLNCPDILAIYPDGVLNDYSLGDPHRLNFDKDSKACEPADT
jgi:hypothetical protein